LNLEREKHVLEQAASVEEAAETKPEAGSINGGVTRNAAGPGPSQTEGLRKQLTSLLAAYKPEHPDVRRLLAEVAQAEALEAEAAVRSRMEPLRDVPKPEAAPQPERPRGNLARMEEVEDRREILVARRTQLAAELGITEQRLQRVPLRQQELAILTREQAFFSDQFRSMAARQQAAAMAAALERSYPSERITVLEQARPPEKPLGPGRWSMLSVASLGGLVIGGLLAIARGFGWAAWGQLRPGESPEAEQESRSPAPSTDWDRLAQSAGPSGYRMVRSG
jgi:hypothetical protein